MTLNRREFLGLTGGLTGAIATALLLGACDDDEPEVVVTTPTSDSTAAPTETATTTSTPTPTLVPLDVDLHVLVDKERALPEGWEPSDIAIIPAEWHADGYGGLQLRADVIEALRPMVEAAATDGVDLRIRSAYRSYWVQAETFAYWVSILGEEQARRESAEPGHSEHQLGTTIDFASAENGWELVESFANTTAGVWLADHAHEYGFALSYPREGEAITGYIFEPWHYRYIGVDAAVAWHESGLTLVEYLESLHG